VSELIDAFCRHLGSDPAAAAALFAPRARLIVPLPGGAQAVVGRRRIRAFLARAPRGLKFHPLACKRIGDDWFAEIAVSGGPEPVVEGARFTVQHGRLTELEMLAAAD